MKHFAWLAVALVPGLAWANDKAPVGGTKVASFTLRDYRGAESSLEQFAAKKAVVLAFVGCECPVAKLYGPRLAKLAKAYEAQGVQFLGIDANQQDGVSQIARFAKDAGIEFPILKDVNNVLADQLGVERTTEVARPGRRANDPLSRADRRSIQRRHFADKVDAERPVGGTR